MKKNKIVRDVGVFLLALVLLLVVGIISRRTEHFTLTTQVTPGEGGSIQVNPPPDENGKYAFGTLVTLQANDKNSFTFLRWSGDMQGTSSNISINMSKNMRVTAEFKSPPVTQSPALPRPTPVVTTTKPGVSPIVPAPVVSSPPLTSLPKWEQNAVNFDPPLTASFKGGEVKVAISTDQELSGGSIQVDAVNFRITGPGLDQALVGSQVASASHPEGKPPYQSQGWSASFTIPANTSGAAQTYNVTAFSPDISETRTAKFNVLPVLPKWEQSSVNFDPPLTAQFTGGNVKVAISTDQGMAGGSAPVDAVSFKITGPGYDQTLAGSQGTPASHPEGTPPYLSVGWTASFTFPANTSGAAQAYKVTASSPAISDNRTANFNIQPVVTKLSPTLPRWEQNAVSFDPPLTTPFKGGNVTVVITTDQSLTGGTTKVNSVSFWMTGPDYDETQAGAQAGAASHAEGKPPYMSQVWGTTFNIPANTSGITQTYKVSASSPFIGGAIITTFQVQSE